MIAKPDKSFCKFAHGINPSIFYGTANVGNCSSDFRCKGRSPIFSLHSKLCGPSTTWKIFKKQQAVIDCVSHSNCDLFPFTYQINDGSRLFLAAHPKAFWYKDEQRELNERHTYEIIRENKPCKLYFDLEFESSPNRNHNGNRMVRTFIDLVCTALRNKYNIQCQVNDVLNLNSSSPVKFSCHLIFQNIIFENNYQAGYFVKRLCYEITQIDRNLDLQLLKGVRASDELRELSVVDSKGNRKLFCDLSVYSKNRHFRLYKSSKFGKNVPLKVSECNSFQITRENTKSQELYTFLCSLITYCSSQERLTYDCDSNNDWKSPRELHRTCSKRCEDTSTPFVEIDRYISKLVHPGSIYRSRYYPEKRTLVYDIVGNRYCNNIGRQHKSNNIKYVVDVGTLTYYQKCYDPDCSDFKSSAFKLPVDESIFINHDIDDSEFMLLEDNYENNVSSDRKSLFSDSDSEDLVEAAERCELLNRSCGRSLIFQDADDDLLANVAEEMEKSILNNKVDVEDDQMVRVAEECENVMLNGKRKLDQHIPGNDSTTSMNDDEHRDKRKMICISCNGDGKEKEDESVVGLTKTCGKSLNLNGFQNKEKI